MYNLSDEELKIIKKALKMLIDSKELSEEKEVLAEIMLFFMNNLD